MIKKMWRNEKGFTLMELIIVIVILGILALIAVPRLLGFADQAEQAADKEYEAVVVRAAELYWAAHKSDTVFSSSNPITITLLQDKDLLETYDAQYYTDVPPTLTVDYATGAAEMTMTLSGESIKFSQADGYTIDSTP